MDNLHNKVSYYVDSNTHPHFSKASNEELETLLDSSVPYQTDEEAVHSPLNCTIN